MNGIDQVASHAGLSPDEVAQIWANVKANAANLAACSRHEFVAPADESAKLGALHVCKNCGCFAYANAAHWYRIGIEHARAPLPAGTTDVGRRVVMAAYLFAAFALFSWDAATWSSNWRGGVAFMSAVGGVAGFGLYVSLSDAFK